MTKNQSKIPQNVSKPADKPVVRRSDKTPEIGGYKGQDPIEHGDWQHKGRVSDF